MERLARFEAVVAVTLAVSGCDDPRREPFEPVELPPIVYAGDFVDIAVREGIEVCRGDLGGLDAHAARVAAALGMPPHDPPAIVVWTDPDVATLDCPTGGCARGGFAISSSYGVLLHEIGHAIAEPLGSTRPLWAEGLAQAFLPTPLLRSDGHPAAMLGRPAEGVDYDQAGLFVRWIWQTYSADAMLEIYERTEYEDSEGAMDVFASVIGDDIVDVGDRFLREATGSLPPLFGPEAEPLPWQADRWHHVITIDCENDESTHMDPLAGYRRTVVVQVEAPGRYEVESDASSVSFAYLEDPRPVEGLVASYFPRSIDLDAGRYGVSLFVDAGTDATVFVEIRPALASVPAPTED